MAKDKTESIAKRYRTLVFGRVLSCHQARLPIYASPIHARARKFAKRKLPYYPIKQLEKKEISSALAFLKSNDFVVKDLNSRAFRLGAAHKLDYSRHCQDYDEVESSENEEIAVDMLDEFEVATRKRGISSSPSSSDLTELEDDIPVPPTPSNQLVKARTTATNKLEKSTLKATKGKKRGDRDDLVPVVYVEVFKAKKEKKKPAAKKPKLSETSKTRGELLRELEEKRQELCITSRGFLELKRRNEFLMARNGTDGDDEAEGSRLYIRSQKRIPRTEDDDFDDDYESIMDDSGFIDIMPVASTSKELINSSSHQSNDLHSYRSFPLLENSYSNSSTTHSSRSASTPYNRVLRQQGLIETVDVEDHGSGIESILFAADLLDDDNRKYTERIDSLASQLKAAKSDRATEAEKNSTLLAQLGSISKKNQELESRNLALDVELKTLLIANQASETKILNLTEKISQINAELESLSEQKKESELKAFELGLEVENLRKDARRVEFEQTSARKDMKILAAELRNLSNEKVELEQRFLQLEVKVEVSRVGGSLGLYQNRKRAYILAFVACFSIILVWICVRVL